MFTSFLKGSLKGNIISVATSGQVDRLNSAEANISQQDWRAVQVDFNEVFQIKNGRECRILKAISGLYTVFPRKAAETSTDIDRVALVKVLKQVFLIGGS